MAMLQVAKTGAYSIATDVPKHVRNGTCFACFRLGERCWSTRTPDSVDVVTFVREPRAHVLSQWTHCHENHDRWFNPIGLPRDLPSWLAYWNATGDAPRPDATSCQTWGESLPARGGTVPE